MPKRYTDLDLQVRIVPTAVRWPEPNGSIAWGRLREGVEGLRGLVRVVDENCAGIEANRDFSPDGIKRQRLDLGQKALLELRGYKPFATAEKAVTSTVQLLEGKMSEIPPPPSTMADVMLAAEIRSYVARHSSPIDFAMKNINDPRVLGALLHAPACLSGLSEEQKKVIHQRAREALHPEKTELQQKLGGALGDFRKGLDSAQRMLLERCEMGEDGSGKLLPAGVEARQ